MRMTVAILAVLLLGPAFDAHRGAAQTEPFRLHFDAPEFSLRLRARTSPSASPQVVTSPGRSVLVECPMPVFVPDLSRVERMPVARLDPSGHAMRIARIGCFNPLGPPARSTPPARPPLQP